MYKILIIISLTALSGCANPGMDRLKKITSMTVEDFKNCTKITDEKMNTYVEFSTQDCLPERIHGTTWTQDITFLEFIFARGYIYKKSGAKVIQIYGQISSGDWLFPKAVNYGIDSLKTRPVEIVGTNASCYTGSCTTYEDFVFDLPENAFKELKKHPELLWWRLRIKTRTIKNIDWQINTNELTAIHDLMAKYQHNILANQ